MNFTGLAAPGELVEVEILDATSQTLSGQESILSRAAALTFVQFRRFGQVDIRPEAGIAAVPGSERAETLFVGVIHGSVER